MPLIRTFIGGVLVTTLAFVVQRSVSFLTSAWSAPVVPSVAFHAFIATALVEESLKLYIVLRIAFRSPAFREIHDGILFAITAGLGFCCLENILYSGGSLVVALNRACTAMPLHALASGLMGYEVGMARLRPRSRHRVWHGLWKAVVVHGTYDLILMLVAAKAIDPKAAFLIVPLLAVSYIWLVTEVELARRKDRAQAHVFGPV